MSIGDLEVWETATLYQNQDPSCISEKIIYPYLMAKSFLLKGNQLDCYLKNAQL